MTDQSEIEVGIDPAPSEGWDELVASDPRSSFCHLSGWANVLRGTLSLEPLFIEARRGDRIVAGMPLYRMPRLLSGTVLVSMPYLNYGGPIGDPSALPLLVERAVEEARRGGDRRLEVRSRRALGAGMGGGRDKVTVVLPLPDDPATLFEDGFKSKLRSQIRRPIKEGMEARLGPEQLEAFYHVFSRNMRDLGTPVLPAPFFERILEEFPDIVRFGAVYHGGEPVSAGCGFHWMDEFEMTWASSLQEHNRLAPNMLLYWSFMERCIEEGAKRFNFGRCTPGGGTHRFKRQWGGEDEPLSWTQWPDSADVEDGSSRFFELATSVWSRLPLPVTNRLGPMLARRLPAF